MADKEQLERLKQGVEAWNQWRSDNPSIEVNLSNANLIGAELWRVNLNGANLTGANLSKADLSRADLITANLTRAILIEANLIDANLLGANLTNANLIGADLRMAQVSSANFAGANLTRAYIEGWNINKTILDDVHCEYIYLNRNFLERLQERRPSDPSRNFASGEFTKLFQEARNTFDLILHDGINWRAFAFAFNETNTEVIDEYGDRLFLRGYELLGDGMVKLKISYPEGTNSQKYQNLLEESYELLKENKGLLKENARLQGEDYEKMLSLPGQVIVIGDNNSVDTRNINTGGGSYYETINTGGGNYIQGNYVNMSQDLTEAAAQIQELSNQWQKSGVTVEVAQEQVATIVEFRSAQSIKPA
ncbi:pentapeptide repeat-containing protein [Leptolyngbyaceae cyanobacterium UHCC 1019]